jgi:hypothetical protein
MKPPGIKPATFKLVAQCLEQLICEKWKEQDANEGDCDPVQGAVS